MRSLPAHITENECPGLLRILNQKQFPPLLNSVQIVGLGKMVTLPSFVCFPLSTLIKGSALSTDEAFCILCQARKKFVKSLKYSNILKMKLSTKNKNKTPKTLKKKPSNGKSNVPFRMLLCFTS